MIVVLVFLPVFMLEGLAGSFFRPLAGAYVLAVLASLGVALTLTPALCLLLLPKVAENARREAPLTRFLKARYRALLPMALKKPAWAAVVLPVVFGTTLLAVPYFGEEFLPIFRNMIF